MIKQVELHRSTEKIKLLPVDNNLLPAATLRHRLSPAGITNATGDRFRIFELAVAATAAARHDSSLMTTAEPMPQQ